MCCRVLLCPTPKDPKPGFVERAGPSAPHLFWVWRCCGCGWFGLPWTTFRRTPPLHWTPLRRTAQNFALFLPFPVTVSLFLCLSGCLLVEFWWCFTGVSHDSPRTPNVHISGHLRFKTPPKFHEKTPRETQKQRNGGGKGKKKREILGLPPFEAHPSGSLLGKTLKLKLAKVGLAKVGLSRTLPRRQSRTHPSRP